MKKFIVLIKKEIREMLTLQTILPMIVTVFIFVFIGNVVGKEVEKSNQPQDLIVMDEDQSSSSKALVSLLEKNNFKIEDESNKSTDEVINIAKEKGITGVVVIPKNFEAEIKAGQAQKIESYSIMKSFTAMAAKNTAVLDGAIATMNDYVSNQIISEKLSNVDPENLKNPIQRIDHVVVGKNRAEVSPTAVTSFITAQTTFIPIILFIVIIFSASMIATTIATEKENKTLETLLTAPVNRKLIVTAKMIGAGTVALLMAVFYIFGFRNYMNGLSGGALNLDSGSGISEAVKQLGLTFSTQGYLILGVSLFLGILCALAIATILGSFAENAQSVNGLISPLMVLVMIPYLITFLVDINKLSPLMKYLIYAIPFSYPFMAAPNIFLHNYSFIFYGMLYQLVFFLIFVYIAGRIFSTDRIVTMRLNFLKKKRI